MWYVVMPNAVFHTCWEMEDFDGQLRPSTECAGCDEAAEHPCHYCGYGHAFTTHSELTHGEAGDALIPVDQELFDRWANSPHLYLLEQLKELPS